VLFGLRNSLIFRRKCFRLPAPLVAAVAIMCSVFTLPPRIYHPVVKISAQTHIVAIPTANGDYRFDQTAESNIVNGRPVRDFTVGVWREFFGNVPLVKIPLCEQRTIRVYEAGRSFSDSSTPGGELSAASTPGGELGEDVLWQAIVKQAALFRPKIFYSDRFGPPTESYTWGWWWPGWLRCLRSLLAAGFAIISLLAIYHSAMPSKAELRGRSMQSGRCTECSYCLGDTVTICPECGTQQLGLAKKVNAHLRADEEPSADARI